MSELGERESLEAPEYRFTDRDVREDPSLRTLAEGYVAGYGGDYAPLLDAKREQARDGRLSTRTARVVLNCMRYDFKVSALLDPGVRRAVPQLSVVRDDGIAAELPECQDPRPHAAHYETRGKRYTRCEGVPWPINRAWFQTTARIKARYAAAAQSAIYHLTSGKGEVLWEPPGRGHEPGPAVLRRLYVDLVCKFPSVLADPMLFAEEPTHLISGVKRQPGPRQLCRYCKAERGIS